MAGNDLPLMERCVSSFARRYPSSAAAAHARQRLTLLRRRTWRRRLFAGAASLLALALGVYAYDWLGSYTAQQYERDHEQDLPAVVSRWQSFQTWHPTWPYLAPGVARDQAAHLQELQERLREQQLQARLEEVRRAADDPDEDPEKAYALFKAVESDFPEADLNAGLQEFREALKKRRDGERENRADRAYQDLAAAESREDLPARIVRARAFLAEHPGTRRAGEVEKRLQEYLGRLDVRTIEEARTYRSRQPLNFFTQRENYLRYLEKYPDGEHASEARSALLAIETEWDRHDYKNVRELFLNSPGEVKEIETRARTYLAAHPKGEYREPVAQVLRWLERVSTRQGYRVRLRSGSLDKGTVLTLSRGHNPSVEVEVNGVVYGPSTIVLRSSEPEWDYDFPRPIQWKLGDPVIIRVIDNYFWKRKIAEIASDENDPVGMRLLSGTAASGKNTLIFESDFTMPKLPQVE
jgi:hypothetical protein